MRCLHPLRSLAAPLHDRRAATSIEYGLIAVLVAVGAIGAFRLLGGSIGGIFDSVTATVRTAL
ncbi:Flp family type IVb pilin [Sphingomonas rubra]|uniref:Flp pilus assembly protein, pilin Flp n=1 Tax=Sphingomonas rubra TaxID=634430 RepID=A0A1I5RVP4_9SPHN|nr:Flp family type IVb pilin [Sphingomonas rubra]SFP62026.1 Flp pilus assembly protein, pilin Flp [Sphingomonas rubra]